MPSFNLNSLAQRAPHSATPRPVPTRGRSTTLSSGRRTECSVRRQVSKAIEIGNYPSTAGGGGSGGSPPSNNGAKTDDFDEEEARKVEEVLVQAGTSTDQLPGDLQDALAEGNFNKKDARAFLNAIHIPLFGYLAGISPALRDRLMGNPRFLLTVALELLVGCTAKLIAEVQARGDKFWKESDFVASDLALEVFCDISTVWLLSPRASFAHTPTSAAGRALAGLPAHALQMGQYSPLQRLGTVILRGTQFGVIGFFASALGHTLTVKLVESKRARAQAERAAAIAALPPLPRLPPRWQFWRKRPAKATLPAALLAPEDEAELAPVLQNSLGWGSFSAVSVQLRYQLVNAVEERLFASVIRGNSLRSATSFTVRFLNSIVGGTMWIWYARQLGLQ